MEVAGVVLGGIPLLIYALDNYKRCLEPGKDYINYFTTLGAIRSHMFMQQEQLDVTLRNIDLVNPTKAELSDHLGDRYPPEKCSEFMIIIERMEGIINDMMKKLDIDSEGKPRWAAGKQDRAGWEWRRIRRSFGRKERDRLSGELQYWNTGLKNIFEKPEIPSDESDPLLAEMRARFNSKHCDTSRQNLQLIYETLYGRWSCSCVEHKGNIRLDWHSSKTMVDKMTLIMPAGQESRWDTLCLDCHTIVDDAKSQPPVAPLASATAAQTGPGCLRTPSPALTHRPPSSSRLEKLRVLFSSSHKKKRSSTKPLEIPMIPLVTPRVSAATESEILCLCLYTRSAIQSKKPGYIPCSSMRGTTRCRIRIECVPPTSVLTTPVPLQRFLSPHQAQESQSPVSMPISRRQRFFIAASVVWGLLYLGDSPWMAKDWSGKDQIQLFMEESLRGASRHGTEHNIDHPTLGHTFKSILPERKSNGSQGATENAAEAGKAIDHFQNSQICNRDLFSLGILLIELCLNKTFEQIRQEETATRSRSLSASLGLGETDKPSATDDFELATRQIDRIYLDAGGWYGYAVQRCLRCEFPGRDVTKTFEFKQFRQHFFNGVVVPVQATFLRQPGSEAMGT